MGILYSFNVGVVDLSLVMFWDNLLRIRYRQLYICLYAKSSWLQRQVFKSTVAVASSNSFAEPPLDSWRSSSSSSSYAALSTTRFLLVFFKRWSSVDTPRWCSVLRLWRKAKPGSKSTQITALVPCKGYIPQNEKQWSVFWLLAHFQSMQLWDIAWCSWHWSDFWTGAYLAWGGNGFYGGQGTHFGYWAMLNGWWTGVI